jgi:hypothetical protein
VSLQCEPPWKPSTDEGVQTCPHAFRAIVWSNFKRDDAHVFRATVWPSVMFVFHAPHVDLHMPAIGESVQQAATMRCGNGLWEFYNSFAKW